MSQKIRLTKDENIDKLSFNELMSRIKELKEPKKIKLSNKKKLTKKELEQYKKAEQEYKKERANLKKLKEECENELATDRPFTDFDPNSHPYDLPNGKSSLKDMKKWIETTYAEDLMRRVYGLSDYQLAVVDKSGKIIMSSLNTEKVFNALFEERQKEKEERRVKKEMLEKALQPEVV